MIFIALLLVLLMMGIFALIGNAIFKRKQKKINAEKEKFQDKSNDCQYCTCHPCKIKNDSSKCTRCLVCDGHRPKFSQCYKN